jgi:DNA-binding transcriptional MerR regulator
VRIGEVAEATGTTTKTLRFYEQTGLLPAAERTAAGYRRYGPDVVERLHFIRRGQVAGLTLAQIRAILEIRDAGQAPCAHVEELLADRLHEIDRQLANLHELRATVAALHQAAAAWESDTCAPETICRFL